MKKIYILFFVSLFAVSAFAQALFNNNGADIYVKDGGFMIVKTNSLYNNQVGGAGVIDNSGTIVVEGNKYQFFLAVPFGCRLARGGQDAHLGTLREFAFVQRCLRLRRRQYVYCLVLGN